MISNKVCYSCAYRKDDICLRKKIKITLDDYCSLYNPHVENCEKCGVILVQPLIVLDKDEKVHTYCVNCYRNSDI